ncbi:hypothetical protein VTK56DRAFT_6671 [Thermocarpiscus australiensis]
MPAPFGSTPAAWDATAQQYAQMPVEGPLSAPLRRLLAAMDAVTPFSSATGILDVGCGPGVAIGLLIKDHGHKVPDGARLIATDFSQGMVDAVKARKAELAGENPLWNRVEAAVYDAQDLHGIADGSMSHVMGNMVYFMLPDPPRGVREAHRVLRPGGVFAMTSFKRVEWMEVLQLAARRVKPDAPTGFDPAAFGNWASPEGVRHDLEAAGFKDVAVELVDIDIPEEAGPLMGPRMVRSNNPGAKAVVETFSEEEIDKTCDEFLKIAKERGGRLKGVSIVASGRNTSKMKYTVVLLGLVAISTAANLPTTPNAVAREADNLPGTSANGQLLEARDPKWKKTGGSSTKYHSNSTSESGASGLLSHRVGYLVAGLAGAGVGAVLL